MIKPKLLRNLYFKLIISLVIIVVLMQSYATTVPLLQAAGNSINQTEVPMGGLFSGQGVIMLIMMLSLAILIIKNMIKRGKD